MEAHTFKETAPKEAANQAQPLGAVGAQEVSQARRHNNGDNGSPATKAKREKEKAKEEKVVTAQRGKEKVKEEDHPWENCGKHHFGDHPLARYNTSPMTHGRNVEVFGVEISAW